MRRKVLHLNYRTDAIDYKADVMNYKTDMTELITSQV